jgi:hypothetical protein
MKLNNTTCNSCGLSSLWWEYKDGGVEPFKVSRSIIDEYNNKNANTCFYCGCESVTTVPSLYGFCDYDALIIKQGFLDR